MEPYFYCVNSYSQIDMHLKYSIQDPDDFHLIKLLIAEVDYIVTINGREFKRNQKDRLESRVQSNKFKNLNIL